MFKAQTIFLCWEQRQQRFNDRWISLGREIDGDRTPFPWIRDDWTKARVAVFKRGVNCDSLVQVLRVTTPAASEMQTRRIWKVQKSVGRCPMNHEALGEDLTERKTPNPHT